MASSKKERLESIIYDINIYILGAVPDSDLEVEAGAAQATRPDCWGGTSSV